MQMETLQYQKLIHVKAKSFLSRRLEGDVRWDSGAAQQRWNKTKRQWRKFS
jgi:hypothetical protein